MNIFDTEWNVAYNVGVKCNALDVTKTGSKIFSSPWDNMDTVRGLTQTADLMASRFENYMADINDWTIWNREQSNLDTTIMRGVITLIWIFNGFKIIQPKNILNGNKVEVIKILIQYGKVFLKHIQEDNKEWHLF